MLVVFSYFGFKFYFRNWEFYKNRTEIKIELRIDSKIELELKTHGIILEPYWISISILKILRNQLSILVPVSILIFIRNRLQQTGTAHWGILSNQAYIR